MPESTSQFVSRASFSWPRFIIRTWAGRILFVNAIVYLITAYLSQSLFYSDQRVLWRLGAQDPVSIAMGEYWRYLTPMFLHGGLIHFFFNSMAILYVGRDLEPILGSKWFFVIYFLSGLGGSIASSVFSVAQSVGASGAIFGLIGAGLYLERSISKYIYEQTGEKPRRGPYMLMLLINLPISFLPMIDANAHLGGFATGFVATFAIMRVKENRMYKPNFPLALITMGGLCALLLFGGLRGLDEKYVTQKLISKGEAASAVEEKIFHYSRALLLEPDNSQLLFKRGKILLENGETNLGIADLIKARKDPAVLEQIRGLITELEQSGKIDESEMLKQFFTEGAHI